MIQTLRLCVTVFAVGWIFQHQIRVSCTPLNLSPLVPNGDAKVGKLADTAPLKEYRLPDDVWPLHYDIEIKPYFTNETDRYAFTYDGTVAVTVTARKDGVVRIRLHQVHLRIVSWSLLRKNNSLVIRKGNATYDSDTEILTLELGDPLLRDVEYLLAINYGGVMEDNMNGFYRSYFNVSGSQVWLGTTQFQQMDARRAFPCFDEPKFKATFRLAINHDSLAYRAYSNTPVESSVDLGENRTLTTFGVTPKMSTYLLAFIVAPFELSGEDEMRILARPGVANQTDYGVHEGLLLLKHLGEWIDYPYDAVPEITRMYMAAVPDFAAVAMENWGLITYKESSLLYTPGEATSRQQQQTTTVIAHELAHQWFGNLVTCEWWDVTWLNEGFATYFEYFGTGSLQPDWDLEQQFVVDKLHRAMQVDGSPFTHPLTYPKVQTRDQAAAMFDLISYNKGAVMLRMMEHFLSTAVFQTALQEYVKGQAFGTARPEDLFFVLNRHNASASAYLGPWTTQSGYPLVTVTTTADGEGFTLTQRRFLYNGTDHNEDWLWPVPITYATKQADFANTMPTFVTTASYNITVANAASVRYFILNNQQAGYYRVNYETILWARIGRALRSADFGGIHVLNRAQIVDDLFNLALADVIDYGEAFGILDYLKAETEYLPWLAASNGFETLTSIVHPEDETLFTHYILDMFSKAYEYVKFRVPTRTERRVHTYLRGVVLNWTCRHGHEDCRKRAKKEFERFRANPTVKVHPDLRMVVYCEGVRQGSTEQFDFLLALYRSTNLATEQKVVLYGLSCVAEEVLIHRFLSFVDSSEVRKQDKLDSLSMLLANPYTIASTAEYIVKNSGALVELYNGSGYVTMALNRILSSTKDPAVRETVRLFVEAQAEMLGEAAYDDLIEALELFERHQLVRLIHREKIRENLLLWTGSGSNPVRLGIGITVGLSFILVALSWL